LKISGHWLRGKEKAAFFRRFEFSVAEWEQLAHAFVAHAATYEVADSVTTLEGVHYTIEGELQTPDGRNPTIRSVWVIDKGSETPRFITAYPLRRKDNEND
jgi:hypothetical protein